MYAMKWEVLVVAASDSITDDAVDRQAEFRVTCTTQFTASCFEQSLLTQTPGNL